MSAIEQIRQKARSVVANERSFGVLSTGEKIAVAFVLDRPDLIKSCWGTLLEGADRLGPDWLKAALYVQRNGWEEA
jgi:hypothetical protein